MARIRIIFDDNGHPKEVTTKESESEEKVFRVKIRTDDEEAVIIPVSKDGE